MLANLRHLQSRRLMRRCWYGLQVFWLGLCWLLSCPALAQYHITQRAWLEDPSGQMTWQDVQPLPFQAYTGALSKGFGKSAIWLRLRIDPTLSAASKQATEPLVLRIRPVYLDDIRVYDTLAPEGLAGITGDQHHPRADKLQGLSFLLPIAHGEQPRDVWVRLVSTSTRQIDVQAMDMDTVNQQSLSSSLLFAAYVGLIAVLAMWGIVHWLFNRDAIVGAFGLSQIAALLYALASLGHLRALWPQHWPAWVLDETTTVFSITAVSVAIWFHVQLLREFTPPATVRRLHTFMLLLLPMKLCMLALGWPMQALQLNMLEVLLAPAIFLISALMATGWNLPAALQPALSRKAVIGFYVFLLVMLMGAALPGLGIVNGTEIALYIVQLHGLVTAFLVLLLLQYRVHVIQQQQRGVAMELERSQMQTQQERVIREEQEKLLAMLAHELKTPLATMGMRLDDNANGARQIRQAIEDMNGVIERCQQTLLLSDKQLAPKTEAVDMVGMVRNAIASCAQPQRVQLDSPQKLSVQTDPQFWSIVLNNLLENACKYAAPDTPILLHLSTATDLSRLRLEIANLPGRSGWPEPEKVFDKYYRSPHAQRQAGTGLGLYLVRNLMQTMGGQIDYMPTADRVRFVIELPVRPSNHLAPPQHP